MVFSLFSDRSSRRGNTNSTNDGNGSNNIASSSSRHHQQNRSRSSTGGGDGSGNFISSMMNTLHNISSNLQHNIDGLESMVNDVVSGSSEPRRRRGSSWFRRNGGQRDQAPPSSSSSAAQQGQHSSSSTHAFHERPPQDSARVPPSDVSSDNLSPPTLLGQTSLTRSSYIDRIYTYKFTKYRKKYMEESHQECQCVICTEDYQRNELISNLPCGHSYHWTCLKEWIEHQTRDHPESNFSTCPNCRYELSLRCAADVTRLHSNDQQRSQNTEEKVSPTMRRQEAERMQRMQNLFGQEGMQLVRLTSTLENLSGEIIQFLSTYQNSFDKSAEELKQIISKSELLLEKIMFALDNVESGRDSIRTKKKENIKKIQTLFDELKEARGSIF